MGELKICVTCAFYETNRDPEYGRCTRVWKTEPRDNPVTGRREKGDHWFASTQRCSAGECGPTGRLWKSLIPVKEKPVEPKRPNIIERATRRLLHMLRN